MHLLIINIYLFIYLFELYIHDRTSYVSLKAKAQNLKMANKKDQRKELVRQFVQVSGADAIPRMSRMLLVDRTITDIDVKDSTYSDRTALQHQVNNGTTGSVAWLLRQDPPPDMRKGDLGRWTALMAAVCSNEDSEGKVRLLLDHGADRSSKDTNGRTALDYARSLNKPAAVIDLLERSTAAVNYSDVSEVCDAMPNPYI